MATGDFVAFLDHDDRLAPTALFEMARAIQSHSNVDVLYSDEDKIDLMFLSALSRVATDSEKKRYGAFIKGHSGSGWEDAYWTLLNTTEFVFTKGSDTKTATGSAGLKLIEDAKGASVQVKCDKDVNVLKVTATIKK